MPCELNQEQIEDFRRDGAIALRGVLDVAARQELATAIEQDIEAPGPFFHGYDSEQGRFHGNLRLWETNDIFRKFCIDSELPAMAMQLFGSDKVNLLYDQLFVKEAQMGQRTRWHNDQPYWPIRGQQVVSIWLALDETTAESGRLEFVRGSHQWDRWFQPEVFGKTDAISEYERNPEFEDIPDIESSRGDYDIISWDLQPGDAYLFHGMTVHGAGGNSLSNRRRRGCTIRYTGDDVTYDLRKGLSPPLIHDALEQGGPIDSERYPVVARTD
jgi:ectoine hydroxylase-related dioxygenase (phytanoyl-CoA dioxygenase family)